jgi:hypothetical protein
MRATPYVLLLAGIVLISWTSGLRTTAKASNFCSMLILARATRACELMTPEEVERVFYIPSDMPNREAALADQFGYSIARGIPGRFKGTHDYMLLLGMALVVWAPVDWIAQRRRRLARPEIPAINP